MEKIIEGLAKLIEEKQGEHLTIIDISNLTLTTKYSVIVTANSKIHAQSLTKYIMDYLIENGYGNMIMNKNVQTNNPWILIDASDIIIHIFEKETREYYSLEKLYVRGKTLINK